MFLELLKKRRSIRKYTDKKIEKEKIDLLLKAALLSPSSRNKKPWEFIVIENGELLSKLAKTKQGAGSLEKAALAIVLAADAETSDVWIEDASIAATQILLMAEHLGLGACWIQVRKRSHDADTTATTYVQKLLDVPEKHQVVCMISIGYPAEKLSPHSEKELDHNKVHRNRFGSRLMP